MYSATRSHRRLGAAMCLPFLAGAAFSAPALGDDQRQQTVTIPSGTVIPVQLNSALSSRRSQPGDRFSATVKYGRDDAGLPEGTRIEGVIREAIPSGDGKPGVLDMDIRRIVFPGNESRPIDASLYSLNGKAVRRSDGRLVATSDKSKDRLKWVGMGAGAGLLLSTIVKGNTLVDTLLGAGAGYLFNEVQNKKPGDVNLKQGQEFGIRLDRSISFDSDRGYTRHDSRDSGDDPYYLNRQPGRPNDDRYYRGSGQDDRNDEGDDRGRAIAERDSGAIGMMINDREVKFDNGHRPFQRSGVVFLPLAAVGRAGNFDYDYDRQAQLISARNGSVRLRLDSRIAMVNGERRRLPAAAELNRGQVYVPMDFVRYLTNGSVAWDANSSTVIVTTDRDRF